MRQPLSTTERSSLGHVADAVLSLLSVLFLAVVLAQVLLSPAGATARRLNLAAFVIWVIFACDFFLRLGLAPAKGRYLRANWLTGLTVLLPALRVVRAVRALALLRTAHLTYLISSLRSGTGALRRMAATGSTLYVLLLTTVVVTLATGGMYAVERGHPGATINSVEGSLWWATATLTTIGSEKYPVTPEGRVLAILVMLYALIFAAYVTARLATLLLGNQGGPAPGMGMSEQPSAPAPEPAENTPPAGDSRAGAGGA